MVRNRGQFVKVNAVEINRSSAVLVLKNEKPKLLVQLAVSTYSKTEPIKPSPPLLPSISKALSLMPS